MLPDSLTLRHLLARLLASCPDRSLRDGARALALAEDLARGGATPAILETLAMAMAETGRFESASTLQAEIARTDPAARLSANLELYRQSERCCAGDDPLLLLP
jgi:hypothetical protein